MRISTPDMRQLALSLEAGRIRTHSESCFYYHPSCAIDRLCDEVDRLRALLSQDGNEPSQFGCGVCGQEGNDCGQDSKGCSVGGLLET